MGSIALVEGRGQLIKDVYNRLPDIKSEIDKMANQAVIAGILPSDDEHLQMIAVVNEYGCHIRAKNGPYLVIPGPKGTFYRLKEVDIPARSFLRSTFDAHNKEWQEVMTKGVKAIIDGKMTANQVIGRTGRLMRAEIKKGIRAKKSPANAPLTVAVKGKDDPLEDTGKLRSSIHYRTVKRGEF